MDCNGRSGEMSVFVTVAQEGSLSAAARALGLTPSAVSRIIARAEQRLGTRLLLRTTRALTFTAEGEATAHVLAEALRARGIRSTRLARGVPVGSELEYVDLGTIAHALSDRR